MQPSPRTHSCVDALSDPNGAHGTGMPGESCRLGLFGLHTLPMTVSVTDRPSLTTRLETPLHLVHGTLFSQTRTPTLRPGRLCLFVGRDKHSFKTIQNGDHDVIFDTALYRTHTYHVKTTGESIILLKKRFKERFSERDSPLCYVRFLNMTTSPTI